MRVSYQQNRKKKTTGSDRGIRSQNPLGMFGLKSKINFRTRSGNSVQKKIWLWFINFTVASQIVSCPQTKSLDDQKRISRPSALCGASLLKNLTYFILLLIPVLKSPEVQVRLRFDRHLTVIRLVSWQNGDEILSEVISASGATNGQNSANTPGKYCRGFFTQWIYFTPSKIGYRLTSRFQWFFYTNECFWLLTRYYGLRKEAELKLAVRRLRIAIVLWHISNTPAVVQQLQIKYKWICIHYPQSYPSDVWALAFIKRTHHQQSMITFFLVSIPEKLF